MGSHRPFDKTPLLTSKQTTADAPAAPPGRSRPWYHRGIVWRRVVIVGLVVALLWPGRIWLAAFPKWQARRALADRRPEQALEWLEAMDWLAVEDAEAEFLRARTFRKLGQLDKTRDALLRAASLGYPVERLEREQWLALAQSGQLREAEPHLAHLLTEPRDDAAEICEAYAVGFIRNHRVTQAAALIDSWAADFPEDPTPLLMRGKLFIELGQWPQAEDAFEKAMDVRPGHPEAAYYLANVLVEQRRLQEALELYEKAAAGAEDGGIDARIEQVRCLRRLGRPEDARGVAEEVLRRTPNHREALVELGRIEADAGRFDEAIALLKKADARNSDDIEVRYAWASALRGAGRVEESRTEFERVRQSQAALTRVQSLLDGLLNQPDDVEARYEVGRVFLEHGNPEKGLIWLQSALDYAPAHEPTCRLLADYYGQHSSEDPRFAELARLYRDKADGAAASRAELASPAGPRR